MEPVRDRPSHATASSGRRWTTTDAARLFVLSSLMVAEERITTKFSGLVGADGSEEEVTFLATQQVDEARHMQFYARFQDEVVADPARDRRPRRARPRAGLARVPHDLRRGARRGPRAARRRPRRRRRRRSRFVTIYHLILEGTLGLTTFEFSTRFLEREGLLPGFVAGYSKIHHDEHRHIGYGVWYLRESRRRRSGMGDVVRATLRELLPAVAESLTPPRRSRRHDFALSASARRAPRVRARRADTPARAHRRAAGHALSQGAARSGALATCSLNRTSSRLDVVRPRRG